MTNTHKLTFFEKGYAAALLAGATDLEAIASSRAAIARRLAERKLLAAAAAPGKAA